jgi:hypothetical protein
VSCLVFDVVMIVHGQKKAPWQRSNLVDLGCRQVINRR